MSTGAAVLVSVLLLLLNAFFVATEFAVLAAKRHRLEERAAEGSRAARAAVAANRELTLMLAGAQLGITLCTLGLGALAEPAVASLLTPVIELTGASHDLSHLIALVVAVGIVVFLHMVIGEMAPKSWAISHPESSALLLVLPFRAFTTAVRPLLWTMNEAANLLVRMVGVTPVETVASSHGPAELQLLLMQSHRHGVLPDEEHQLLTGALRLEQETVAQVMLPPEAAVTVAAGCSVADVEQVCRDSGRSRLLVTEGGRVTGLVHVRDAVRASAAEGADRRLDGLVQRVTTLPAAMPLIDAVALLREQRAQLAVVTDAAGATVGMTAMEDMLEQILGEFDDETDEPENAGPGADAGR